MNDFIKARVVCLGECNGKELDVMFRGRHETATYTDGVLHYLIEDRAVETISDHETGEILYERDEHGTMWKLGNNPDGSLAYMAVAY